jgi:MFS family permease
MPDRELRRARAATTLVFFLTGAVMATYAARIPAVQERLGLSAGELGLAILGLEAGAIAGLPAGGALVTRIGSRASLRLGFAVYPAAMFAVALVPGIAALAAVLAAMAFGNSVIDVAMNAQGVELERRYGRPVMSGLHAGHSFGLVGGGLAATAVAAAGIGTTPHFAVVAALAAAAALLAIPALVAEPRPRDGQPSFARPSGRLLLLGLVAFCAFLLDGAAYNWSAVHLRSDHDAAPGLAAAAFTAFSLTLALGRLVGDRLVERLGRARTVQGGCLLAAAGVALAIAAPGAGLSLAGWALFGAGLAPVAPAVLGAAPGATNLSPPVAIATVTTVGYLGSFTGPPLIGALAELSSLSAALGLLIAVALAAGLLARRALCQH